LTSARYCSIWLWTDAAAEAEVLAAGLGVEVSACPSFSKSEYWTFADTTGQ